MIATILAVIYITFICWSYGSLLLRLLAILTREKASFSLPVIITCFTGLAFTGALFTALSLFVPTGHPVIQLFFLLPAFYWVYSRRVSVAANLAALRSKITGYPLPLLVLLCASILLVLVMHSGAINHPDTLNYHAQHIEWIKNYRAVPGIVHLNINLGTQSSWFVVCALFSFSFTGTTALTFVNAAVLCWFLVFIVQKINESFKERPVLDGLLWLVLLIFSFWSYTQLRLTATSGSPDFIAALYTWLIIYLFIKGGGRTLYALLVFLGFFAVTIKLSALPCILLSLYAWYRYAKASTTGNIFFPLLTASLVLIPYLANNVINTGYLLFPLAVPDLFSVDWKTPHNTVVLFQQYVMTYARTHVPYNADEITKVMNMKTTGWLPAWWQLRSLADKLILVSAPLLLVLSLFFTKRIFQSKARRLQAALIFCLAALIFWFIQAPDPRFGFGFLLPFSGILLYLLLNSSDKAQKIKIRLLSLCIVLFSLTLLAYSGYRLANYFPAAGFVQPAGINPVEYHTTDCRGILLTVPVNNIECGRTPLPCTNNPCGDVVPRGNKVENGFRGR